MVQMKPMPKEFVELIRGDGIHAKVPYQSNEWGIEVKTPFRTVLHLRHCLCADFMHENDARAVLALLKWATEEVHANDASRVPGGDGRVAGGAGDREGVVDHAGEGAAAGVVVARD
jgi:hypothetical protein